MQISLRAARRRPRATVATLLAGLMVLVAAGVATAAISGPDVSSHQHPNGASVDWAKVKNNGREFAFVKSTEGVGYTNPYFTKDWAAIKANGMVRGTYHYARPDRVPGSAAAQARYMVSVAGTMQGAGELAPVLDLEDSGGLTPPELVAWARTWLETITSLTGRTPIIYTYPYFWRSAMANSTAFTKYPLWIADYNGASAPKTPLPGGWTSWTFWQYTDRGTIPGVSTGVDISHFCCDSGTLASLSNGGVGGKQSVGAPSAILAHHQALGGTRSYLGATTSSEYAVPGGRAQNFAGGVVYWSASTGARAVRGAILEQYLALGGPSSPLGLPVTDELSTADGAGRYNNFASGGALYWSPKTGAREVRGDIDKKWGALTWEAGPHGYPVTNELGTPDGKGRYNHFQQGSIYWTATTGAQSIRGDIKQKWAALSWEAGVLGYPTTDELGTPDGRGRYNHLQGGSIYWTPTTGAHEVRGAIKQAWSAQGWERGALGYPTSGERAVPGGRQSDFQGGSLFWDAATGVVSTR
ncbi:GH25 family lysozyme [Rhodococcus sp. X156]|uniref:GH25 family lysozyme n=1 Tax=Rhodococcus sp. X156 TaxID=2499145 RepID=UPI0013E3DB53|nr:GH25 family lysozyme [Rhodococcus sp. X156]